MSSRELYPAAAKQTSCLNTLPKAEWHGLQGQTALAYPGFSLVHTSPCIEYTDVTLEIPLENLRTHAGLL